MRICEHCGAGIPNYAGFCGMCGQLIRISEPADRTLWKSRRPPVNNEQILATTVLEKDEELAADNEQPVITTSPADHEQPAIMTSPDEDEELTDGDEQPMIMTAPDEEDEYTYDNEQSLATAISEQDDEYTYDNEQPLITAISDENEALTGNDEQTLITNVSDDDNGYNEYNEYTDDEEGERRDHLALIETSLPLAVDAISEQTTEGIPVVLGNPQISASLTVQGTPTVDEAPTVPQTPSVTTGDLAPFSGNIAPLVLPNVETAFSIPFTNTPPPLGQAGRSPRIPKKPQPQATSGCTTIIILVFIVPFIILGSIIGVGFTFLAPTLSLTGSENVTTGGVLHISGSHFIPGNTVTCVLDGGAPLAYSSSTAYPTHEDGSNSSIAGTLLLANQSSSNTQITHTSSSDANTAIIVGGDGTFHVTFPVGQDWKLGKHTIHATEALSPRSANITFTVTSNTSTGTVTSGTPTTTTSATATPATATPTAQAKPGISAITPNAITFGPISVGYTQPVSTQVIINTTGSQLLAWAASWDQTQAPWLQMNIPSGQIQAPNAQTVVVSASVGNLKAGTYNSIITFTNTAQATQSFSLPISLTVQAGCITTTSTTLTFAATMGGPDPTAQTVALNNCGALGNWSEAVTGGSWLQVSPTGGTLNSGATQNVVVSTTLAAIKSGAGTYQGQIVFTNGTVHTTINVTFAVQDAVQPAVIAVTPTSISTRKQCTFLLGAWFCSGIVVSNSQTATSDLNWAATATGITGITITPNSGTLTPGQTATVEIDIPRFPCVAHGGTAATVTFTGPTNSIPVTISC